MKTVTMYMSDDGKAYATREEALRADVVHIMYCCMKDNTHQGETFFSQAIDDMLSKLNIEAK